MPDEQTTSSLAYTAPVQQIAAFLDYLNPEYTLAKFERFLKGEVYDSANSTTQKIAYKKVDGMRKMNDYGVNKVMAMLYSVANPSTTLGLYSDEDISRYMKLLTKELAMDFTLNWRTYDMNPNERFSISMMILRLAHGCLKRTLGLASDKALLGKIVKSVESIQNVISEKSKQEKKFDPFHPFGGGK